MPDLIDQNIFQAALDAASAAFKATLDDHFGRTYDGSEADLGRVLEEYRASGEHLRHGESVHLRTGLIDADFTCWHSDMADGNFGDEAS